MLSEQEVAINFAIERLGKRGLQLKDLQKQAIESILQGNDAFVQFPTGYGKSLVYQVLPFCYDNLYEVGERKHMIVVISPLLALIDDQVSILNKSGCKAVSLVDAKTEVIEAIKEGKYSFIYTTPESIVDNQEWKSILMSEVFQNYTKAFVVDEAHCLIRWSSFRPTYKRLPEVISIIPSASIISLTATATLNEIVQIKTILCMKLNCATFRKNIVKNEIHYSVSNEPILKFLISLSEELKSKGKETKRTIIYSTSLERIGLYFESMGILLKDMLQDDDQDLYGMYCSATRDDVKVKYLKSLQEEKWNSQSYFCFKCIWNGSRCQGNYNNHP